MKRRWWRAPSALPPPRQAGLVFGALVVVAAAAAVFELPFGITVALLVPAIAAYVYASWKAADARPLSSDDEFRAGLVRAGGLLLLILLSRVLPERYSAAILVAFFISFDLTERTLRRRNDDVSAR
jgi:hypothetical protein